MIATPHTLSQPGSPGYIAKRGLRLHLARILALLATVVYCRYYIAVSGHLGRVVDVSGGGIEFRIDLHVGMSPVVQR